MTYYDSNTWVNFKLFGMLGLTLLFVVLQSLYLARYVEEVEKEQ
jgi:intracellular septation protein